MDNSYEPDIEHEISNNLNQERLADEPVSAAEEAESDSLYKQSSSQSQQKTTSKGKLSFKKFGPAGLIATILGISTIGISTIMTPALAISHFATSLENTFNTQSQAVQSRMDKLVDYKLRKNKLTWVESSPLTQSKQTFFGKRVNRFGKVSKTFEKNLTKNGFSLELDEDRAIKQISFTDPKTGAKSTWSGNEARKFAGDVNSNTSLKRNLQHAQRGKFGIMVGRFIDKIKDKLGLMFTNLVVKRRPNTSADDIGNRRVQTPDDIQANKMDNVIANAEPPDKVGGLSGIDTDDITRKVTNEVDDTIKPTRASGADMKASTRFKAKFLGALNIGGDLADLGADACQVYESIQASEVLSKTQNAIKLIRFALAFFSVADAIKAGDATEETIAFIGNNLLSMIPDENGQIKTGMNSTGFIYSSQGVIRDVDSALAFANAVVGGAAKFLASFKTTLDTTCTVVKPTSKILQAGTAIAFLLAIPTGGISLSALLLGVAQGVATSIAVQQIGEWVTSQFQGAVTKIPVSSKTKGGNMGEAITSGFSAYHSKTAASSGIAMATVNTAKNAAAAQRVFIAKKAEEERATRSPFDVSSPYTFLGSIIFKAWPYQTKANTLMGKISALFGVAKSLTASIMPTSQAFAAVNDELMFTSCPDVNYQTMSNESRKVAFDIYCNPVHVPPISVLYTPEEAQMIGLAPSHSLVADANGQMPSNPYAGYLGKYFTPEMVNRYFAESAYVEGAPEMFDDHGILKDNANPLWRYYKNCKLRADNNIPYGNTFTNETDPLTALVYGEPIDYEWGDGPLSRGDGCVVTDDPLIEKELSDEELNDSDKFFNNYTDNGRTVMFMLLMLDERAQCIWDGEENCQDLWNPNSTEVDDTSYGNSAPNIVLWPLQNSRNITSQYSESSKGIIISGQANESVLAVIDGTVKDISHHQGSLKVSIQSNSDPGRVDVYNNLSEVSVEVGNKVSLNTVIGKIGGSDDATHQKSEGNGTVLSVGTNYVVVEYDTGSGDPHTERYTGLQEVKVKIGDKITKDTIIGLKNAKNSANLFFQVLINGSPVDPMPYLSAYGGSWQPPFDLNSYRVAQTPVSLGEIMTIINNRKINQRNSILSSSCLQVASYYSAVLYGKESTASMSIDHVLGNWHATMYKTITYPVATDETERQKYHQDTLKTMYDNVTNNKPVVAMANTLAYLDNGQRDVRNRHFVTVVGVKSGANPNNLKEEDFLIIDPEDGKLEMLNTGSKPRALVQGVDTTWPRSDYYSYRLAIIK